MFGSLEEYDQEIACLTEELNRIKALRAEFISERHLKTNGFTLQKDQVASDVWTAILSNPGQTRETLRQKFPNIEETRLTYILTKGRRRGLITAKGPRSMSVWYPA